MSKNIKILGPVLIAVISLLASPCGRKGPDAPLSIVSTYPEKNGSEIPRNAVISVTFSEPVDENTIHFSLLAGSELVPATMNCQEETAYFTPADLLAANTVYTAVVSGGVRDLYGEAMSQDYLWYFVTGATTTTLPSTHTVTGAAGPGGAISPSGAATVNDGAVQQFTVTADGGYHIATVTGCGGTLSGSIYTTGIIKADCTVTASFALDAPVVHTVTGSAGPGGSISPSGAVSVNQGESLAFTITPDPGFDVSDVLVDGSSVGAVRNYTFEHVTTSHTITASFAALAPAMHTITAGPVENGSITPGTTTVQDGAEQSFKIEAHFGYYISEVTVDNRKIDGLSRFEQEYTYTFTNVTSDHTITARFRGLWHISATFGENGTISPAGQVAVEDGADQTFTISTDLPYVISELVVDGGRVEPAATYTFAKVSADHSIHANFARSIFLVTPEAGEHGAVTPAEAQHISYNQTAVFIISPDEGYAIGSVEGCGGTLSDNVYTTGPITGDCTVTATFNQIISI